MMRFFRSFMVDVCSVVVLMTTVILSGIFTQPRVSTSNAYFTSRNNHLYYLNKTEFLLKGINYAGFESYCAAPHGLWAHNLDFYLDFIAANDFNAIRLPFSYELTYQLDDPPQEQCVSMETNRTCTASIGNLLECFFEKALARNLFILLDFHTINYMIHEYPLGNLDILEFYGAWDRVLERTLKYPNLLGIDIKNEPHGNTTWNTWGSIVMDFIYHIQWRFPHYQGLFFVEGVQGDSCWGGSFADMDNQLDLSQQNIVFSPHTYGVSVLGDVAINYGSTDFEKWFGFLVQKHDNAIVVGEAGGFFTGEDMYWHLRYMNYLKHINQTSTFYWSLNPDSSDTHGILNDDWTTYNADKLRFLKQLQPHPTKIKIPPHKQGT